jgi:hypothetical protein
MTTDRDRENAEVYEGFRDATDSPHLDDAVLNFIEVWACRECGSIGIYLGKLFHWFQPKEPADFRLLDAIKERT